MQQLAAQRRRVLDPSLVEDDADVVEYLFRQVTGLAHTGLCAQSGVHLQG